MESLVAGGVAGGVEAAVTVCPPFTERYCTSFRQQEPDNKTQEKEQFTLQEQESRKGKGRNSAPINRVKFDESRREEPAAAHTSVHRRVTMYISLHRRK